MKRAWVELVRWSKQRAVRCTDCGHLGRQRAATAHYFAQLHFDYTGHQVTVRRG